ncbi:MAG: 5-formyltetrahydrofolate cyclo-ligase [Myxococcota bacterium]
MKLELEAAKGRLRDQLVSVPIATASDARVAGAALAVHWLEDVRLSKCPRVALYAAQSHEMPTRPLFDALRERGRILLFPRCDARGLFFAGVEAWEELEPGRYGIPAPPAHAPVTRLGPRDAVLVPGLAFDAAGHRLGRGAGWYDQGLPAGDAAPCLVGATYASRLLASVPHGSRDRDMDAIVTERGLQWVQGEA